MKRAKTIVVGASHWHMPLYADRIAALGLGYVGGAQSDLAVPLDDECLHEGSPRGADGTRTAVRTRVCGGAGALIRNSRARLTKSSWNWNTPPCPASG
jgi:hypothetical protein